MDFKSAIASVNLRKDTIKIPMLSQSMQTFMQISQNKDYIDSLAMQILAAISPDSPKDAYTGDLSDVVASVLNLKDLVERYQRLKEQNLNHFDNNELRLPAVSYTLADGVQVKISLDMITLDGLYIHPVELSDHGKTYMVDVSHDGTADIQVLGITGKLFDPDKKALFMVYQGITFRVDIPFELQEWTCQPSEHSLGLECTGGIFNDWNLQYADMVRKEGLDRPGTEIERGVLVYGSLNQTRFYRPRTFEKEYSCSIPDDFWSGPYITYEDGTIFAPYVVRIAEPEESLAVVNQLARGLWCFEINHIGYMKKIKDHRIVDHAQELLKEERLHEFGTALAYLSDPDNQAYIRSVDSEVIAPMLRQHYGFKHI